MVFEITGINKLFLLWGSLFGWLFRSCFLGHRFLWLRRWFSRFRLLNLFLGSGFLSCSRVLFAATFFFGFDGVAFLATFFLGLAAVFGFASGLANLKLPLA